MQDEGGRERERGGGGEGEGGLWKRPRLRMVLAKWFPTLIYKQIKGGGFFLGQAFIRDVIWVDPHVWPIPLLARKEWDGDRPVGGHKGKSSSAKRQVDGLARRTYFLEINFFIIVLITFLVL